jgi:hypothetical protein
MRKLSHAGWVALTLCCLYSGSAFAIGGKGDMAAHIKAQNAACEQQKRGEIGAYPDMCLPEYPPGPGYRAPADRR